MTADNVQPAPAPRTPKEEVEAHLWLTKAAWSVTTWFWALLFSGAGITLYLQNIEKDTSAIFWLLVASLTYVASAVSYGVANLVGSSRLDEATRNPEGPRSSPWLLYTAQAGQIGFLVVTLALLIVALAVAYGDATAGSRGLDEQLADRVETYVDAAAAAREPDIASAIDDVLAFCKEHEQDDETTRVFLETCSTFKKDEAPPRTEGSKAIERLRKE